MKTLKKFLPAMMVPVLGLTVTVLAQTYTLPDPLEMLDGSTVTTAQQWQEERRAEVLELFREHVYGRSPDPDSVAFDLVNETAGMMDGAATRKQVDITVWGPLGDHTFRLLIFLPANADKPVPLFLHLNNRDESNTDPTRSTIDDFWPAEEVIARGYGIAALQNKHLAPDNKDTYRNGVINIFNEPGEALPADAWRAVAAWAWGGSRAMDYFETDDDIDETRIAVIGHSRGGKTALWCGAEDERFAMVISNNSGCTGAALSRNKKGERVARINSSFPHWFCGNYDQYNDNEDNLPIDQHELIALMAPRLVYVASAETDNWADQEGEFLSAFHAGPVYELFDLPPLGTDQQPALDEPVQTGYIGYHIRTGGHDLTSYDWGEYMDFADEHLDKIPVSLSLTSPGGGEVWTVDSSYAVTWTNTGYVGNVQLEYSTGGDWTTIVESTENDGSHEWTLPDDPSATATVRVTVVVGDWNDVGDAFEIKQKAAAVSAGNSSMDAMNFAIHNQVPAVTVNLENNYTLTVYNSSGKKLAAHRGTDPRVHNFSGITQPGLYFITLESVGKSVSRKFYLLP